MDVALLANELANSREKQKFPGILCKLDLEKAYDHANWKFLLKVIEDMGFGKKWINWICSLHLYFKVLSDYKWQ